MTIAALILTCLIFVAAGWTGSYYAPIALCIGAVVCIAACNGGATSQDLKTGYIVGATPMYQQVGLLIGVIASVRQLRAQSVAPLANPRIVHVGIVLTDGKIIHAAGQVRIDRLDHFGIFNEERGIYSHKLRVIKRFLPDLKPSATPLTCPDESGVSTEVLAVDDNQASLF